MEEVKPSFLSKFKKFLLTVFVIFFVLILVIGAAGAAWWYANSKNETQSLTQSKEELERENRELRNKVTDLENKVRRYEGDTTPTITPTPSSKPQPTPTLRSGYGIIEGSIIFTNDNIPSSIKICAESTSKSEEFCTTTILQSDNYKYGIGYRLSVEAQKDYTVYLKIPSQTGLSYFGVMTKPNDCSSFAVATLTPKDREIRSNVDLGMCFISK